MVAPLTSWACPPHICLLCPPAEWSGPGLGSAEERALVRGGEAQGGRWWPDAARRSPARAWRLHTEVWARTSEGHREGTWEGT